MFAAAFRPLFAAGLLASLLAGCDAASLVGASGALTGAVPSGGFAITRTNADPSQADVTAGASVTLSVETSKPADRYAWSATGGDLSSYVGNPVTWTAPSEAGTYVVDVTASAGGDDARASFRFTVR